MKPWSLRTQEEAHLFNPAFCCAVLTLSISTYATRGVARMPFPLAFLVLPIILHKRTRENLPRSTATSLAAWMQQNQEARLLFHERLMAMKPYTKEAVCFGVQYKWLELQNNGELSATQSMARIKAQTDALNGEAKECVAKAALVGKWFSLAGTTETVMTLWGVRP